MRLCGAARDFILRMSVSRAALDRSAAEEVGRPNKLEGFEVGSVHLLVDLDVSGSQDWAFWGVWGVSAA